MFQINTRTFIRWTDQSINHLSKSMNNSVTVAVAVFVLANSSLFSALIFVSDAIERMMEENDEERIGKKREYSQILTHAIITGVIFISFNILLSRITKYHLSLFVLTAISTFAIGARLLFMVIKIENENSINMSLFDQESDNEIPEVQNDHSEETEKTKTAGQGEIKVELESEKAKKAKEAKEAEERIIAIQKLIARKVKEAKEKRKVQEQYSRIAEEEIATEELDVELKLLACAVKKGEEEMPFPRLQHYWQTKAMTRLKYRHQFVQIFGSDSSDGYQAVRAIFANKVYRQLPFHDKLHWLSEKEIVERIQETLDHEIDKENCKIFGSGYYFHSTSLDSLKGILKSGILEVRCTAYKGAFVSTSPFVFENPYVLVFKRVIENLSTLINGFYKTQDKIKSDYWAGFSHDIPVNHATLAHILKKDNHLSIGEVEELCEQWAGRKIRVIGEKEYLAKWKPRIDALGMGIPNHWHDKILNENKSVKLEKVVVNFDAIEREDI